MPCTSPVDLSQPAQVLPVLQRIAFAKAREFLRQNLTRNERFCVIFLIFSIGHCSCEVPREIVEKETNETAEPEARESSCHGTRLC